MARSGAITAADRQFLNGNKAEFKHLWQLVRKATLYNILNHDELVDEVEKYIDTIQRFADREYVNLSATGTGARRVLNRVQENDENLPGFSIYRTAPVNDRYVVFSDIHITPIANRQGFFNNSGNKALYLQVLADHYAPNSWTLVENGDVEELLIYEPVMSEVEGMRNFTQEEIDGLRETKKRETLEQIAADHADYYQTIDALFASRDRYFRTIGNHDYDLSDPDYADIIKEQTGLSSWRTASDVLLLTGNNRVRYIIAHGHQFDTSCVPKFANYLGENYSQGSAWAFQGPDRFWTDIDDGPDFMHKWLDGSKPYRNMLVTADVERDGLSNQYAAAIGKILGTLNSADGWEALYGKNIAWEYFINSGDPKKAIKEEVETGNRWIKFRHMDEFKIVDGVERVFAANGPKLILGHSHEPRINPGTYRGMNIPPGRHPNYINSAAAGRFQNLIWGVEIVEGNPSVISWHRDLDNGIPTKTIWRDEVEPNTQAVFIRPNSTTPYPTIGGEEPPDDTSSAWLAATSVLFT